MLLMSNLAWILIGVGVVILVVFIGTKIKDKYYQKGGDFHWFLVFRRNPAGVSSQMKLSAKGGRAEPEPAMPRV